MKDIEFKILFSWGYILGLIKMSTILTNVMLYIKKTYEINFSFHSLKKYSREIYS